jgi:hypothetical protein
MPSIQKTVVAGLCALTALGAAPNANATIFGGIATLSDTSNSSVTVTANPNPKTYSTTSLTANQSYVFNDFMTLSLSGNIDTNGSNNITLAFDWSKPSEATTTSQTGEVDLFKYNTDTLSWDGEVSGINYSRHTVTFTDGAQAYLDVYNADFTNGDTAAFNVRITDIRDPTAVPEPASMALLGVGMIGTGVMARRRRPSTSTSAAC